MKIIVQRVKEASVVVNDEVISLISSGYLLYVCIEKNDTLETIKRAAEKVSKLRINEDSKGLMNLDIKQTHGSILSVSQFTLSWNGKKGHRPSFDQSMAPDKAQLLFNEFNNQLRISGIKVSTGEFGEDMLVKSINDGPVTFILDF